MRHFSDYAPQGRLAIAIGNFDGFHLGHQRIVATMREGARELGLTPAVMCFEPQSNEYLGPGVARLYTLRDKLSAFRGAGVELVACPRFGPRLCAMDGADFAQGILASRLRAALVVVGEDFRFGKGGRCGIDEMRRLGQAAGIGVRVVPPLACRDGERISSTRIRECLRQGDLEAAGRMLGHPYAILGRVARGRGQGAGLGYPTANVPLRRAISPVQGVYAVWVDTPHGTFGGMCDVGTRPSVAPARPMALEAHLFNFSGSLYGAEIRITFVRRLRGEEAFPSLQALRDAIARDALAARSALGGAGANGFCN
ncbi:MAG: riboflavin biosynthesis protein RibF [Succinivibrionaceae bacterium]|nr:riboflavin biosynthesis protein RibF [Succinivibrionaceae bacterium]